MVLLSRNASAKGMYTSPQKNGTLPWKWLKTYGAMQMGGGLRRNARQMCEEGASPDISKLCGTKANLLLTTAYLCGKLLRRYETSRKARVSVSD